MGWRRVLWPALVAALLPFLLVWLPPARWHPGLLGAAGALTLVIAVIMVAALWERLPGSGPCILAFAYLFVAALLRAGGRRLWCDDDGAACLSAGLACAERVSSCGAC